MKILKIVMISLLWSSFAVEASLKDQIRLNEARYNSSVKPILQSISNDFYGLLTFLRPDIDNLMTIANYNIKIKMEISHINRVCPQSAKQNCQASLNNIEYYLQKQEVLFAKLFSKNFCNLETTLYCVNAIHDLTEAYLFNLKSQAKLKNKLFSEAQFELDRLRAQTHVLVGQLIPDKDHKETELVWFDFFKNIEEYFLVQNNPKLFLEWVDKLNFSINEFNMIVEQKEKTLKPGFKGKVEQIHGKWNSMIREFL